MWQDIEVFQSINKALTPVANMTNILGGENYVTVSAIKPLLTVMSKKCLAVEDANTPLTKDLKTEVDEDMQRDIHTVRLLNCWMWNHSLILNSKPSILQQVTWN